MQIPPLFPTISKQKIPFLTTLQMIEVDRRMIEVYGITLIQMMENAGRNLARWALSFIPDFTTVPRNVTILCGSGGNGGGGMVCARHLTNRGANVTVLLSKPAGLLSGVPAHQLRILQHMRIPVLDDREAESLPKSDLIIDALIGHSLKGNPQGCTAKMIHLANEHSAPVLTLDIPSGIDGSSGMVREPVIHARATMTLALPKQGLVTQTARPYTGRLFLADISVPPALYKQAFGFRVGSLFSENEIIELV